MRIGKALASRKLVYREVWSEGSETAKLGTDEQKVHKRHGITGKRPHHRNAPKSRVDAV